MAIEIKVPSLGESVVEATIAKWHKNKGDQVEVDEPILELETDKVTLEVPSPSSGIVSNISHNEGDVVEVGTILGSIDETAKVSKSEEAIDHENQLQVKKIDEELINETPNEITTNKKKDDQKNQIQESTELKNINKKLSPSVRKQVAEKNIDIESLIPQREDGRITKSDLLRQTKNLTQNVPVTPLQPNISNAGNEERVPMSRLRQTIAKRLKDAQNTAAILTTFNEVDMSELIRTRNEYKDSFQEKYGVKLGFMSFFVKACVTALKEVPEVNAEIENQDVIYKNYYNIGVAVGTEQGLVVPVVNNADSKSLVEIEKEIYDLGNKARDGKLSISDMQGGTFTISNGGVYGSLMSTPILNPPQSGVLGMHKIEDRPIVANSEIKIKPMMYLALSYDHRLVDGKGAVTFLVRVKESLEDPNRILLGV
tara:strand:- start:1939 stop:3216 length:1278 start_codon:yes stop_codon:yes gene_type:complete